MTYIDTLNNKIPFFSHDNRLTIMLLLVNCMNYNKVFYTSSIKGCISGGGGDGGGVK